MEVVVPDAFRHLYDPNAAVPIVKVPAEVLRTRAVEIVKPAIRHKLLADNMIRMMRRANGVGLAAPQVGVSERLIVVAPSAHKPLVLVDPEIVRREGEVVGEEGCLSIPGLYGDVVRAHTVEVVAKDIRGRDVTYEMSEMPARIVQHEIDHLNGVLFIDLADPATLHWMDPNEAGAAE